MVFFRHHAHPALPDPVEKLAEMKQLDIEYHGYWAAKAK